MVVLLLLRSINSSEGQGKYFVLDSDFLVIQWLMYDLHGKSTKGCRIRGTMGVENGVRSSHPL